MATGPRFDETIVDLERLLRIDAGALDQAGCAHVLSTVQRVRGQLSSVEALVSARIDMLAAQGQGAPAPDTHSKTQRTSAAEARRRSKRAKLLNNVPKMRDALTGGTVTDEHVDALAAACAKASDEVRDRVLRRQKQLTKNAERLSPEKFRKYCQQQVQKAERDEGLDRAEQQRRNTSLRSWLDSATGMRRFGGEIEPELGARIWNAIQVEIGAAIMSDESTRLVDRDRLAAEALGRLVAAGHGAARPNRPDVVVHVDLETLLHGLHDSGVCELSDGTLLPPETVRRLACEAHIIPAVLNGAGMPLDVGRSSRLATAAQRTALRVRHETCAFPNCDVAFDRCEVHHLLDWNNLGPTDLANLTPVCSRHHHLLHEGGWHARLTPNHVLEVWPPGSNAPADAVAQSRAGAPGSGHAARDAAGESGGAGGAGRGAASRGSGAFGSGSGSFGSESVGPESGSRDPASPGPDRGDPASPGPHRGDTHPVGSDPGNAGPGDPGDSADGGPAPPDRPDPPPGAKRSPAGRRRPQRAQTQLFDRAS